MRITAATLLRTGALVGALAFVAQNALAQQLDENCTVSVLNRNVRVNPDGSWVLPNVPANFGLVRARVTCIVNGQTVSGESEPFLVPPNGAINVPRIIFGSTTPIPTAVTIAAPAHVLTTLGSTVQLAVTATYADGTTRDVTGQATGTQYTDSNATIATITGNGLVQAVRAGTVLIQATHEGRSGMISIQVSPGGIDTDADGIPDDAEVSLGLNPQSAIDASEDFDRDNLTNLQEYQAGTDIRNADTDADMLSDGQEIARGTSPLLRDTDGDGIGDGLEVTTSSNPLDPSSYNLQAALSSITVAPSQFVLTFNTILGDVSRQLRVTGALLDGTTINLTSRSRGTNYASSNLNICNFSGTDGLIFAGDQGSCAITVTVAGFTGTANGEVHRFAPTSLSSLDLGGTGLSIDVSENHAFVAVSGVGLKVIDVSNRNTPFVAATLNLPGTANDVKIAGSFAYVAAGSAGLHIVDISNPLSPQLRGTFDTSGDAQDVRVYGNLAFIADGASGLQIVDVSTPTAPRLVGSLGNIGTTRGIDVDPATGIAAIANGSGLRTINISSPAQPASLGSVTLPGDALDVVVRGTIAYVADYTGSLQVVNMAAPSAPVVVGTTPTVTGGMISDIAVSGNFAFGADIFFVNGVPIVDVTTANNPVPRAILAFPGDSTGRGVAADGSYVYLVGDDGRLYIGQYRLLEDLEGIAPVVTIVSPAPGTTFVEGETIPITVNAIDDVAVVSTEIAINGTPGPIDTTPAYQFTTPALVGASTVILSASAIDLGGNVGTSADLQVNVIPDPLTTVVGRVVNSSGVPVAGAVVTCLAESTVSAGDGSFSVPGVRTIQPLIFCTADILTAQGVPLHASSARVAPVRAGTTQVGDLTLLAVPVITSIRPRAIDSFRPPTALRVTGANLTGATFAFVAEGTPIVTTGTAQIDPSGTSAFVPISVAFGSQGTLVLSATNAVGSSETFATANNTVIVVNLPPTGDVDADGLTNEYELLIATDPAVVDSDGDGLPDGWEVRHGLNPLASDAGLDSDSDGSTNGQEFTAGTDPRNPHTAPPQVVQTFPTDGATDYPTNGVFIARFAEPLRIALPIATARSAIDQSAALPLLSPVDLTAAAQALQLYMHSHGEGDTVAPGTVTVSRQGSPIAGGLSLSNDRLSVTFTPTQALLAATTYAVSIQNLRDAAGVAMTQAFQSSFTTGVTSDTTAPYVLRTNPSAGASGVPINAVVTLQFSERVDPATVTPQAFQVYDNTIGFVAGMIQVEPDGLFASFVPSAPWSIGRSFSVYPSQEIRDVAGNRLNYSAFSFSTGFDSDTEGPTILAVSPPNGTNGVPLNAPIQLQFSEPLDAITAATGMRLLADGGDVTGAIALSDGNRRLTFTPTSPLQPGATFTIVPSQELTDIAGNLATTASTTFTTGTQPDNQSPTLVGYSPTNGTRDVPTNAVLTLTYNERLNPISVNAQTVFFYPQMTGIPVAATLLVSADGRTIRVTPSSLLAPSTTYSLYAYGVTDLVGYAAYNGASFTTGSGSATTGPAIEALSPPDGSADVPLNARVVVRMNTPISPWSVGPNTITLTANGVPVAGAVTMSGDRSLVFTPAAQLTPATVYSMTVAGATDLAGNVTAGATSTFTTGTAALTTNPSVISVTPGYTATDVAVDASIQITFSAPVDPSTVHGSSVYLWSFTTLAATYQVNGNVVTVTPVSPLPGNTQINLQVSGVQDLAGNNNNYYYQWFRTAATFDTTAPTVLAVTPSDGSMGVGLNAQVVVTFSESLNSSTVNGNTFALFANGTRIGGVSGISQDNRTVYLSAGQFPAGSQITVAATPGVQDLSGNALADFSSAFTTVGSFDANRPSVISQRPSNGASGVGLGVPLVLFVNERMEPASIAAALHVSQNGQLTAGDVNVTGNGQVVTFTPETPWQPNALVQIFFDGNAVDLSGNQLSFYQGSFRTAEDPATAVPVVTSFTPNYGSGNNPLNQIVTMGFNVPIDPASVTATTVQMSGPFGTGLLNVALSLDSTGRVIRLTPPEPLQANVYYYVWTNAGIRSTTGVPQQSMASWYFYTGSATDNVAPTVRSVTPPHGAVNVGDNAAIIVRFDEAMNPQSINGGTLAVASALGPIGYSISFGNSNRDLFLTPFLPLPDGEVVTVTVAGVTDTTGNAAAPSATQFAVSNGPDLTPPVAISTNPANGLGNVPTNTAIALRISEQIDPSTVSSSTFPVYDNVLGQQLAGSYSISSDGRTINFVPSAPLGVNRSHSVYFTWYGMTDLAGNYLGAGGGLGNFSFTTGFAASGAGPQAVAVSPADHLVGVPRNTQIVIDFDRAIDALSVDLLSLSRAGQPVPTLRTFYNGDTRVILTPVSPLAPATVYTITIGAVTDLSGSPATLTTQVFTTASGVDLVPPVVTVTSPVSGSAGVPTNVLLTVGFSERIDPTTVHGGTFPLYPNVTGIPIAASYLVAADGRTATLIPSRALSPFTSYTAYLSGVADLTGQGLYYSWGFTTGAGPRNTGPAVVAVSPPNGSTNVPLNARVTAYVDTALDPLSVGAGSLILTSNGTPVSGAVSLSSDRRALIFVPSSPLSATTTFSIDVANAIDVAGNALQPASSSFTTGTTSAGVNQFSVSSVTPSQGTLDVPVTTAIEITMTNAVNPASIDLNTVRLWGNNGSVLAANYQVNGAVITVTPSTALPGSQQINLQVSGVLDLAGNQNNYLYQWFRTAAVFDVTPPTIIAVTPIDGATDVGLSAPIAVTFSESLNPATVGGQSVGLIANGTKIGSFAGISSDNRTVFLSAGYLPANTQIAVVTTSDIQDLSGNPAPDFSSAFTTTASFDTSRPSVVGQRPGNGAAGVAASTPIVLFLNEPLDPSTTTSALRVSQNGQLVAGTVQVNSNAQTLSFEPNSPWLPNALIQMFLDATARDTGGNAVNPYQGSFRTAEDPATAPPVPIGNTPGYGQSNVPLNAVIRLAFNVPIDPTTINSGTVQLTGPYGNGFQTPTLSVDASGRVISITPAAPLEPNVYYYVWTNPGIRSATGVAQTTMASWYFYTGSETDSAAPAVMSITPPHGAVNVGDNAGIIVRFNEPINPLTVNASTIAISGPLAAVRTSVVFSNNNRDVTLTPLTPLPDGQVVTVSVSGLTDFTANAVAPTNAQFVVGSGPDLIGPAVVATNPANGLNGVPTNAVMTLRVNEPIDPASVNSATFVLYDNVVGAVNATRAVSSDGRTISLVPLSPLGVNRSHSVYFQWQGIYDLAGNPLGSGGGLGNYTFTTGSTPSTSGPQVVNVSPADQLTNVPRNTQIVIDFDRAIDLLTADRITLDANGQAVVTLMSFANGDRRVGLTPALPLLPSTVYTLTIGTVSDVGGIPLETPQVRHFTTAGGADFIGPVVTLSSPMPGASNVPTNALIELAFSERIATTSVNAGTFVLYPQSTGQAVPASFLVSADGRHATLVPSSPLLPSNGYTAYASGVTDLVGQGLYYSWSFTTGSGPQTTPPTVLTVSPPDGTAGVPVNARVALLMSAPISPVTLTSDAVTLLANGVPVSGSISLSGDRRSVTFTPAVDLAPSTTYAVTTGQFFDVAGNAASAFASSFTTGAGAADTGPLIVNAITPSNGAQDVAVNATIVATFNKAVNPLSVNTSSFQVYYPGVNNVSGSFTVNGASVSFVPSSALPGDTNINVQINGVQDLSGISNNYVNIQFHTAAVADTDPPTVVSVTPNAGSIDVGLNSAIVVMFSESLNPATVNNNTFALFANGSRFGGISSVSSDSRTVTLTGGTLPASSIVTLVITGAVQDLASNALADFTSSFTTTTNPDTSRPSVVGQRPGNGANAVASGTPVVLFLSERMNASTVGGAMLVTQNGTVVGGGVQVTGNGQVVTFTPSAPWAFDALIQVFLDSAATDINGNSLNAFQSSFRTESDPSTARPVVTATSPVYGTGNAPLNPVITLGFNIPLDPSTVDSASVQLSGPAGLVDAAVGLDATGRVVMIAPSDPLVPNSFYSYQTTSAIRGQNGLTQQNPGWWYFYTGASADNTPPGVRSVTPPHSSTNVGDNAAIVVRFSEPINPMTANGATIAISAPGGPIAASISLSNQNRDVFLTPYTPLPDSQVITVSIAGVTDPSGNAVTPTVTQFAVAAGPDLVAPMVTATNPANGLGNVPLDVVIALRTNEPIDASSVTTSSFVVYDNSVGPVSGTTTVSSDGRTINFVASAPLVANRSHSVYFMWQGITDLSGNPIGPSGGLSNFSFTTGTTSEASGPQVVAVSPSDGLTAVPRNAQVVIDFDRAIDALSLDQISLSAGAVPVAVAVSLANGDSRVVLTPQVPLNGNTLYTVSIGAVTDLSGAPLQTPFSAQFTTSSTVDLVGPSTIAATPAYNTTGVALDARVQVTFSERVNPLTVNGGTFYMVDSATGQRVAGDVVVSVDAVNAAFIPSALLTPSTTYYVYVSGFADLTGQQGGTFLLFRTAP